MAEHTAKPARMDGISSNLQKYSTQLKTNTALQMEAANIEFKVI